MEIIFEGRREDKDELVKGNLVVGSQEGHALHRIVNQDTEQEVTGEFTSYSVIPSTVRQIKTSRMLLDEAIAQFIGFVLCNGGFDIVELVSGMGLKHDEWMTIKEETSNLDEGQVKEIDDYFKERD
ncbi:hypothetical protein GQ472_01920 [archaeon]|nr:hypothetical protein [archaeon]